MAKKSESELLEEYQNEPSYWGKEDPSDQGKKAAKAAEEAVKNANEEASKKAGKYVEPQTFPSRGQKVGQQHKAATDAAQNVIRNKLPALDAETGGYKKGGMIKSSASKRADGCAQRGKTKGRMV